MASPPNPNNSQPAAVDQRRLQFVPVDLPLSSPMVDASPDAIVDITSLTEATTGEKRKREGRLRSIVWQHFTKLIKEDGTCEKCKCNHCHKLFTSSTRSGTTHLLRHISEGICPVFKKVKKENSPTVFSYMSGSIDRKVGINPWKFDQELDHASMEQSIDAHDDLLSVGLDDIERQTCTTSEGDYGRQTSMPVSYKLPQQPAMKSQPIAASWMSELRTCVGKLVELTNERVSKPSVDKTCVTVSTPDLSISSVVKCLNEMEDIPQSSAMYLDALDIVRDPEERECFICLNPEPRRRWLQRMLHRRFPLRYSTDV
ncbi:uncharacterized protein LOC107801602 [Nicotiana tabacum]|uniref:Uncharacterized protein LOC107801602 n=2 Tax=Nicotiana TaxID=4085 RepID=A0A1S4AUS9_TOBAC|nr:PREDICTED: uncharacterized protein LOC104240957 [Nicotiana sylvestris]XP_016480434.1 PREDICTED: uncharacterized protein LOC107801602 [Nicotiana tabacum]